MTYTRSEAIALVKVSVLVGAQIGVLLGLLGCRFFR
jgi:hypothetical protein